MRWLDASPRRAAPKGHETFILRAAASVIASYRERLLSAHTAQNARNLRRVIYGMYGLSCLVRLLRNGTGRGRRPARPAGRLR